MAIGICATVIAATFQLFIPHISAKPSIRRAEFSLKFPRKAGLEALLKTLFFPPRCFLLGAAVGRGLFTMMQNYQGEAVGQLIGYRLRLDYYRKLQQLSFSWHDRVHSGDLMTRGILDIDGLRHWVDTGFLRMILLTCLIGGGAVILIRNDLELGLMALSFVPIVALEVLSRALSFGTPGWHCKIRCRISPRSWKKTLGAFG